MFLKRDGMQVCLSLMVKGKSADLKCKKKIKLIKRFGEPK